MRGVSRATTLPGAIAAMWDAGELTIAVLTAITAIVAPALFLGLRLYVLGPARGGAGAARPSRPACGSSTRAGRWNMVEVFTLGHAVAGASRERRRRGAGPGLLALAVVMLLSAGIEAAGLKHLWWQVR
jgi:uncharacterized paraquat-inducible protein A